MARRFQSNNIHDSGITLNKSAAPECAADFSYREMGNSNSKNYICIAIIKAPQ
jgi:hypothetical protein